MKTETYRHQTSHQGHVIFSLALFLIGSVFGYGMGMHFERANEAENKAAETTTLKTTSSTTSVTSAVTSSTPASEPTSTPAAKNKTYFAKGSNGKYSLIDVTTGGTKDFTPSGYSIVDQHNYSQFPSYLILEKEKQLYSYDIVTKEVKKININAFSLGQQPRLSPSISEKDKFYIEIETVESNDFGPTVTKTKGYFLDAKTSQVGENNDTQIPNEIGSNCYQYDSKYTRFFDWRCGEGIGSATPLTVYDYTTKTSKEVVAGAGDGLKLEYNNGEFLVISYSGTDGRGGSYLSTIARVKSDKDMTKDIYTVSDEIKSQTADSAYSAMIIGGKNLLVMGGAKSILLIGYDSNKKLTSVKSLPEPNIYANSVFSDGEKLYYKSSDTIKVVNLDTKQVEKSFTYKADEEVTLVALPE